MKGESEFVVVEVHANFINDWADTLVALTYSTTARRKSCSQISMYKNLSHSITLPLDVVRIYYCMFLATSPVKPS